MIDAGNTLLAQNYTPVGDLSVVAVCFVMLWLIFFSYIRKTQAFRVFLSIILLLIVSALLNVTRFQLSASHASAVSVAALSCLFRASLFLVFFLFTGYIAEVTHLEKKRKIRVLAGTGAVFVTVVLVDVLTSFPIRNGTESSGTEGGSSPLFLIGYLLFALTDIILLVTVHRRLYKRVMWGFYSSIAMSFGILLAQRLFGRTSSFTVVTFLFPVLAMFYIMHSNPYDADLGTVGNSVLSDIIREDVDKKKHFVFMSLFLPYFAAEGKVLPETVQVLIRKFSVDFFRGAVLLHAENGHLLLVFRKTRNPDFEHRIQQTLSAFSQYYRVFRYDYKIVIGESVEQISRKNEYISFIRSIHRRMETNSVHRVSPDDIGNFDRNELILRELQDIDRKKDLNDERVQVYCQPVYNLETERYDTAEALMRLQLDELGLVTPDRFIFLAEENGCIHTLTEIILHKTCEEIRRLINAGFDIGRVSVNVSTLELKGEHFSRDISTIIAGSGIPGEKIAIELTESRNESDFNLMKDKMAELQAQGIKFYLDDFGTGYSNMERIIELPFDIIKFDRSLVTASGTNKRSEKIVSNMANLFRDLNYSVLYEGVETDTDESICREMSASYLQGFKYSRPVPISDLRRFVSRKNKAG